MKDKDKYLNIIFLDFDGVINIKDHDGNSSINYNAIKNINRLCLETGYKIVISSSWKDNTNFEAFLHELGLDEKIEILGRTEKVFMSKEMEIKKYLGEHHEIKNYLIIDDSYFGSEFASHHVQPAARLGFTENKYEEAIKKISSMK